MSAVAVPARPVPRPAAEPLGRFEVRLAFFGDAPVRRASYALEVDAFGESDAVPRALAVLYDRVAGMTVMSCDVRKIEDSTP